MSVGHGANVLIVQRRMTHYRVPMFEYLRSSLEARGVSLIVANGEPHDLEASKRDSGKLSWATTLRTNYFFNGKVCWQPFWQLLESCDLVIVTHENKLLCNLFAQYFRKSLRVALWGHGANLQGRERSPLELWKKRTARQADWWFTYTKLGVPILEKAGFPASRITVLNNAVDMRGVAECIRQISSEEVRRELSRLEFTGQQVGVFIGSLYREKCIPFMLEAALLIKSEVPAFEFLIAGDGPERQLVESFCKAHQWARYVGPVSGRAKALALRMSSVVINPGAVGLGILDSFVAGIPLATTHCGLHGPEIAYLEAGANGAISEFTVEAYASSVACLLRERERRTALRAACLQSAESLTLDRMVDNFATGIVDCLSHPPHRPGVRTVRQWMS